MIDELEQTKAELARLREQYMDLIMQVANKWPGETRHETAKRYIVERENASQAPGQEKAID